jgi:hypothetical protein
MAYLVPRHLKVFHGVKTLEGLEQHTYLSKIQSVIKCLSLLIIRQKKHPKLNA